jgi:hypothetical protein
MKSDTSKITKADLKAMAAEAQPPTAHPDKVYSPTATVTAADFNKAKGKKIAGGANVLLIPENSGAGPFTVTRIERVKVLDKRYGKTTSYHAEDSTGAEYAMPAATSFVAKAAEGELGEGDTFLIWRNPDYKARGKMCQSYAINITKQKAK